MSAADNDDFAAVAPPAHHLADAFALLAYGLRDRGQAMAPKPILAETNARRKTPTMRAKPGFDWSRVHWSPADAIMGEACSLCGTTIAEDAVPLMMWRDDGSAAQFCDKCASGSFGVETYPEGLNS